MFHSSKTCRKLKHKNTSKPTNAGMPLQDCVRACVHGCVDGGGIHHTKLTAWPCAPPPPTPAHTPHAHTNLHVTVPARLQSVRRGRHRDLPLLIGAPAATQQVPLVAQHVPAAMLVPLAQVEPADEAEATDAATAIRSTSVAAL